MMARLPGSIHCSLPSAVIMEKIGAFDDGTQKKVIQQYFSTQDSTAMLSKAGYLTFRPYLGRRWTVDAVREHINDPLAVLQTSDTGKPLFPGSTRLQGFPMFRDELIDALGANDPRGSTRRLRDHLVGLGAAFAAMHWGAGLDGEGCEFLYGPRNNRATLWVHGFDKCGTLPPPHQVTVEMAREHLVPAAHALSAYLPNPDSDEMLWIIFANSYLEHSQSIHMAARNYQAERVAELLVAFLADLQIALVDGLPVTEAARVASSKWSSTANPLTLLTATTFSRTTGSIGMYVNRNRNRNLNRNRVLNPSRTRTRAARRARSCRRPSRTFEHTGQGGGQPDDV